MRACSSSPVPAHPVSTLTRLGIGVRSKEGGSWGQAHVLVDPKEQLSSDSWFERKSM